MIYPNWCSYLSEIHIYGLISCFIFHIKPARHYSALLLPEADLIRCRSAHVIPVFLLCLNLIGYLMEALLRYANNTQPAHGMHAACWTAGEEEQQITGSPVRSENEFSFTLKTALFFL